MYRPKTDPEKKTSGPSRRTFSFLILFAALFLLFAAFLIRRLYLRGAFLPRYVTWNTREETICTYEPHPLYPDPGFTPVITGHASLMLDRKTVTIRPADSECSPDASLPESGALTAEHAAASYSTPSEWLVSDALIADLNADGIEEILLLVWKRGTYGGVLPFWVDHDDRSFSEHLYIFHYQDGALVPVWMASKMPYPVETVSIVKGHNGDSPPVSFVRLLSPDGEESFWVWDHWGLKLRP